MYQHRCQHIKSVILGLESGQELPKKCSPLSIPLALCINHIQCCYVKTGIGLFPGNVAFTENHWCNETADIETVLAS